MGEVNGGFLGVIGGRNFEKLIAKELAQLSRGSPAQRYERALSIFHP
jgi:hypothetical protein